MLHTMNPKRLVLTILTVFVGVWFTDFLIHGIWLQSDYKATASLWRTEAEMQARFGWLLLGQFLVAVAFVVLWAAGFAEKATLKCALLYGLLMGLFAKAPALITFAVQPFPPSLSMKWFCAGLAQAILMGLLIFLVYKPKSKQPGLQ